MGVADQRKAFRALLAPLGCPVLFRGELLPASGAHAVIDPISDTDQETWESLAPATFTVLQLSCWAESQGQAIRLDEQARPLLAAAGWHRQGASRYPQDDPFHGAQSDYRAVT